MKHFLTLGMTAFLLGCAAKKPVQPITGPAVAKYKLSDCKPLPGYQPGIVCNHVQIIPLTLPVKK